MATYDLVIHGGTVIDPAQGLHSRRDVAISAGIIAALSDSIPASDGAAAIDASGKLVVPGLIDLHAHIFPGVGDGAEPERDCLARGTTTVVDGGSVGHRAFLGFKRYVIDASRPRIKALLNISSIGLIDTRVGELMSLNHVDPDGAAKMAADNPEEVIGFKIRVSGYVAGGTCLPSLRLVRQAADATGLPIMVHIGESFEPLPTVLEYLQAGDVVTHTLTGRRHGILGYDGRVWPEVLQARQRGVLFDAAHGRMHLGFDLVKRVLDQGFQPDTLSTDITVPTAADPTFHLPTYMSKLMALGVGLDDAVAMVTSSSSRWLGQETDLGTLRPGAQGDVAILELLEGEFTLRDNEGQTLKATSRLRPWKTVYGGQVVDANPEA